MRAIPVLVVLVWVYFALPIATGLNLPPFWSALLSLSAHLAAYVAEVVRAGIQSVRPGQVRAGMALGMTGAQILRKIVMPQAVVRMLPAFGSLLSLAVKDTAIATVIGRRLGLPVAARPREHFGWFAMMAGADMAASSQRTRALLNWQPSGPGLLEEIDQPAYYGA